MQTLGGCLASLLVLSFDIRAFAYNFDCQRGKEWKQTHIVVVSIELCRKIKRKTNKAQLIKLTSYDLLHTTRNSVFEFAKLRYCGESNLLFWHVSEQKGTLRLCSYAYKTTLSIHRRAPLILFICKLRCFFIVSMMRSITFRISSEMKAQISRKPVFIQKDIQKQLCVLLFVL